MKGIWTLVKLDLLIWRRMPFAIFSAIIPPVGMTLILITLSLAVTQQPIALVVKSQGPHTQKMQNIIESDTDAYINYDFKTKLKATDPKTAQQLLDNQQVAAVITIPKNFDQAIEEGDKSNLQLLLNNVDIDFADDIRRSVDRSVAQFDAPLFAIDEEPQTPSLSQDTKESPEEDVNNMQPIKNPKNPYLIAIDEHDLRKTNVDWLHYQIIPALILLVLHVGLIGTALLCAQDIERKTSRFLALTPQQSWMLVTGRLAGGSIASLIALIPPIILCSMFGIIAPPAHHWPVLIAIFVATSLCASGLGAIIGTMLIGSRTIAMASSVVATYMFFLGGGFTTIAFLPSWLQTISAFIPMRYAIDGMRQALFYTTLDGVIMDVTILCLTAIVTVIIGSYTVRHSWTN